MAEVHAEVVWLDGGFVPWDAAKVHVLTHTLHYGLGVFEGTRVYRQSDGGSAAFRLADHLKRLARSAHILDIDIPFAAGELHRVSLELVARNQLETCYLRHLVFVGRGAMGLHPRDNPIRVAVTAWPWGAYLGEEGLAKGIRCTVSSYARQFPNASMMRAKACGNYITSILAKREAVTNGFEEAILLDTQGCVAEGSGENIFLVRDGRLKTPPPTAILEGLTRHTVIALAARRGLAVEETAIPRDELYIADEVFLTGTAAEVTPVREIDGRRIGDGAPGPVTRDLQQQFFAVVRGEVAEFRAWLAPVCREPVHREDGQPVP